MPGTFKSSAVIAEARKIAAEQPDFNYNEHYGTWNENRQEKVAACIYFDTECSIEDSTGMCLFGRALENLGADPAIFFTDEWLNQAVITQLYDHIDFENDDDRRWMREAQHQQDSKHDWGQAIERADQHIERRKAGLL